MRTRLTAIAFMFAALAIPSWAAGSGSFQLKIFQGFRFSNGSVIESSKDADLSFTYQTRRMGMISYLSAERIKKFDSAPDARSLTSAEMATWKDYVAGPDPGYYVIRARDGKHYVVNLRKFENQGKAASYWLMSFTWEEIAVK